METYYDEALSGNGNKPRVKRTRRDYYWICAVEKTTGTPVVDGPYDTEEEAEQTASQSTRLSGEQWEILPMRTVDRNRATAEFRHQRVQRFGRLDEALKRTGHKI